jgi:hypothetical protein
MAAVGSLGSTKSESAARNAAGSVSGCAMNGDTASPAPAWTNEHLIRNVSNRCNLPALKHSALPIVEAVDFSLTAKERQHASDHFRPQIPITMLVILSTLLLTLAAGVVVGYVAKGIAG